MKSKLLLLLFLATFSIYAQTNLVPNGGFEDWTGTGSTFTDWTTTNFVTNSFDVAQGIQSARLVYQSTSPKITTQVPMKAGVTYTIKYKYKYLSANYDGTHPIALNISKAGASATLSNSTFATNNLWTEKETTFTADKDLSYDFSISTFSFDNASFEVLIDAIQVYVQGTEQFTQIPNLNFEKKLIALGLDSGTPDGQVPTININTIKYLDISRSSISDLTGLEDFTSLTSLDCSQSGLTSLDLSKNPNLLRLNCSFNNGLTNFDASTNPNLVFLDCSYNNLLTLNLTGNPALQYLEATSNYLTTLDLSNNTNLIELQVRSNRLASIDLSKNTALKQASLLSNLLTSLNVSSNTALEVLDVGSNKLTSIDLSKNKLLKDLTLYGNQLTSLDLSANNALIMLNCSSNKLTGLNLKNGNNSNFVLDHSIGYMDIRGTYGSLVYSSSFASNPLSCIQVDYTDYSNTNWSKIKDNDTNYTSLDCSLSTLIPDSKFEDELITLGIDLDGRNGAVLNSSIKNVTTLNVSGKGITNLAGIEGFTGLTSLNVSDNTLKRLNLSKNTLLTTLNTFNNPALTCVEVPDLTLASTWAVTKDATTSFSLDCNVYTLIPDPKFEEFLISKNYDKDGLNGKVLTENIDKITILNMNSLGISDLTGIQDFASLIFLQAYGNQIETIDVSKNKALTNLDLDNNKLTKIDLSNNTALISVDLTNNLISEIDLTNNLNLKNLQVGGNKLSKIDLSANTKLTYILANNNKLTSFDISNNPDVFQVWCQNNQIRSLDFSKNSKLVQILAENNKLVNLNFKNGANTLIDVSSGNNGGIRFAGNPDLKCIQVDDVAYSDANWSAKKDATATFSSAACPVVIPYTLIPDANFEAKLIALGIDKDGIAGKVETMNIVNLTSLNLANTGIADLRGIEDFAALTSLDVSNNKLTTIDVSKNIDLKTLNVSRNQLTSLNVSTNNSLNTLNCATNAIADLDVTRNTELSSLSCNSNAITRLDVARNTKLTVLNASFNKLQYLDVSKNALLKEVDAASNDLYNLNLKNGNNANMQRMIFGNFTQNPHLACIEVDDVAFSEANWIAKDATASYSFQACPLNEQQTLIPDPAFERILIAKGIDTDGENGKVRTASISGLTNLTLNDSDNKVSDLTGIQDFKSLLTLEANRNNLKTIDLSQNTALSVLYLIDNQLTDIDLSNNPLLWFLDVNGNELTNLDLSKNTKLMHLSASYNKLTDINLSLNTQLTALSIDSNLLTSLDVSNNVLLTQILCSYNKIGTLDLSKNTKLVYINASDNKLYNVNIKNGANNLVNTSVYASFIDNPYLKCIQVDDVDFSNTNWSKMKDAAVVYSSDACPDVEPFTLIPDVNFENKLIALGIDKDGPNGKVATYSIDSVTSLNVSKSDISDLTGLQDFKALTSLEAAENKLTTINVSNNTLLTNLNVSKNQLTSLNTSTNYRLLTLNCSANSIAALDLTENRSLSDLNCSKNAIAALDLSNLSDLTNLNCSTNALTALNVSRNKKLTVLSTSINKLENLDVSRNTALKEIDCADNELYNLNLQNGNNVNMERVIFGNFTQNPNLLCIQVDDAAFSNDKWIAKDATATYSSEACPLNGKYTLIPDPNFEKILIAKKIDIDGENGKVLTSRIESVTYLDVTDSTLKISDLTGIQDFKNLSTLYCSSANLTSLDLSKNVNLEVVNFSNNKLTSIDLSANTNLTSVAAYNNELTSLDLSKNTALKTLTVYGNDLTSLNISKNTALTSLDADNNQLSTLDISANTNLTKINLYNNQLTSLDFSKNPLLKEIRITSNKIENINVSNLNALTSLVANNNQLSTIDVSRNTGLLSLEVSNNKLTAIDVSLNTSLTALGVSKNQLKTLDITKNTALIGLLANDNQLTSLDLRNGKNNLMQNYNLSFTGNPQLYCILVDDVAYSNTNWSSNKDAVAKYNTECTGELVLASNNFTVETKGESCLGENNGEISIVGKASFAYNAMINDKPYTFTDNALKVTALTPGVYKIKITIPEMIFEQNFNVTIQKGAAITGKSSVSAKNVEVEITEGTAPFTVFIDGAEQFQTTDKNFTVSLDKAALVEVATAKACEGVFAKKVTSYELGTMLAAYPNPTTGTIEIEIPSTKTEIAIELYNFGGQLVSHGTYNIESGKALLNLEKLPSGIYAAKINLDTPEYIKIIKK